jgi:DNA polymerase III subunit delta'
MSPLAASSPGQDLFWLAPQLEALRQARSRSRLPHALLIQDAPGAGGEQLALLAAQVALCTSKDFPCGSCRECQRVRSGSHPDLWFVTPEEDSRQIKVDQIRELNETLSLSAHGSAASVAIISPADLLNANAANALLKTLEEPRPGVLIVLVATVSARLPATVLSRCLRLQVRPPPRGECIAWLRQQRGAGDWEAVLDVLGEAPLAALAADPGEVLAVRTETEAQLDGAWSGNIDLAAAAERWSDAETYELRLRCAENWITRCLATRLPGTGDLAELRTAAHLPSANSSMTIRSVVRLVDALYELRRLATTTINKSLAVEQLLWLVRAQRKS